MANKKGSKRIQPPAFIFRRNNVFRSLAVISAVVCSLQAGAYQISPNPNLQGNTIFIEQNENTDNVEQYVNAGVIENSGTLINIFDASFTNTFTGTINNRSGGAFFNDGELFNNNVINNFAGGTFVNEVYASQVGIESEFNNYGVTRNRGEVSLQDLSTFLNAPGAEFSNSGTFSVDMGWFINEGDATVTNNGSFFSTSILNSGLFFNQTSGSVTGELFSNRSGGTFLNSGSGNFGFAGFENHGGAKTEISSSGRLTVGGEGLFNEGLINSRGKIISQVELQNAGTINNSGVLEFSNILTNLAPAILVNTSSGEIFGAGSLTLDNFGSLTNQGSIFLGDYSTLRNAANGELTNSGSIIVILGGVENDEGANFVNNGGISTSVLENAGLFFNQTGGGILAEWLDNSGGTFLNSGTSFSRFLSNDSGARISTSASSSIRVSEELDNRGVIEHRGYMESDGTFQNTGLVTVESGGEIFGSGIYSQTAGETTINGALTKTNISIDDGLLQGVGVITTNNLTLGGRLAVGNDTQDVGQLSVNADVTVQEGARLDFDAFGTAESSSFENDVLAIFGDLSFLGGLLTVSFDQIAAEDDSYRVWTLVNVAEGHIYGLENLSFDFFNVPSGLSPFLHTSYNRIEVALIAASVSEPPSLALLLIALSGLLVTTRRRASGANMG